MGDITLDDIEKLLVKKLDALKKELKEEMKDSNFNLEKEMKDLNSNLKKEMKDLNSNLEKELKNTNYKIGMLQSTSGKVNTFLDALSPAAAVGSEYHKTNSYYSE